MKKQNGFSFFFKNIGYFIFQTYENLQKIQYNIIFKKFVETGAL